jgi:xanthine dehydrogenase accessory factor
MIHNRELEQKAEELNRKGIHYTLATVVRCQSPTSAKPGAKALVTEAGEIFGWIGGGCAQPAVIKTVRECIKSGQPQLIRVTPTHEAALEDGIVKFNMACHSGGTLDIFIEPVTMKPLLLIIGTSPVARALARLASMAGFEIHAMAGDADLNAFPDATQINDSMKVENLSLSRMPYVVISTQGKRDEAGLKAGLAIGSPYTALVASQRKAEKLVEKVSAEMTDKSVLNTLRYPAGVEIAANSPEEIAVALLAQLIQVKNTEMPDMSQAPELVAATSTNEVKESVTTEVSSCCSKS